MTATNRVLAIIMAGGAGERLRPLTNARSKAAVPFGGKFRLVDFTLSNCVNSGIRRIYVLTQYRSDSLNLHIQNGWHISGSGLGDFIYCVPAQQKLGNSWYVGTADAVRQNLNLITKQIEEIDDVLILSGDHVYKMDYSLLLDFHRMKNSSATICACRTTREEASGKLGVLEVDQNYRLKGFEEKPLDPKSIPGDPDHVLASMGVYLFKVDAMMNELEEEKHDFGKNILPEMAKNRQDVHVYDFDKQNKIEDFEIRVTAGIRESILVERTKDSAYWRDVGTIDSYYEASMDLLSIDPLFNLYGERWPIRTFQRLLPPSKYVMGGKAQHSISCDGCIISDGYVTDSILSPGVIVEKDAIVENSIIFDDVIIEPGARVRRAIIDKNCRIRTGTQVGHDRQEDIKRGFTISGNGIVVVPKEMDVNRVDTSLF